MRALAGIRTCTRRRKRISLQGGTASFFQGRRSSLRTNAPDRPRVNGKADTVLCAGANHFGLTSDHVQTGKTESLVEQFCREGGKVCPYLLLRDAAFMCAIL